jgi:hypothetical protein
MSGDGNNSEGTGRRRGRESLATKVKADIAHQQERVDAEAGNRARTRWPGQQDSGQAQRINYEEASALVENIARLGGYERQRVAKNIWEACTPAFQEFIETILGADPTSDELPETDDLIELFERAVEGGDEKLSQDSRFLKTFRKALREAHRQQVQEATRIGKTYQRASDALGGSDPWPFNLGWLSGDKQIQDNFARAGNKHVLGVLKILYECKWDSQKCISYAEYRGLHIADGHGNLRPPLLVTLPTQRMHEELGLSEEAASRHLRALGAWDLIRDSGYKDGSHGPKLWMLGYWITEGRNPSPVTLLKENRQCKEALRSIDVWTGGFGREGGA